MNICFFTENYYKGGLDTFLINLINSWPDNKDNLTLVCNGSHPGLATIAEKTSRKYQVNRYNWIFTSTLAQGHSKIKWLRSFPVRVFFVLAFWFLQYPVLFPLYVFLLANYFRRSDFDRLMVVNGGYPASLLGRSAIIAWRLIGKRPLAVMNIHNYTTYPPWYLSFFENLIDCLIVRSVSHIVSVSKDCLSSLNEKDIFSRSGKLSYIYNGIEDPVKLVKPGLIKSRNDSSRYCLMLATYEARKGHSYLLQAFTSVVEKFPDIRLHIYGYGRPKEREFVIEEVNRLGLEYNVILGDFKVHTADLLSGATLLVVPSQSHESFGLTIIEAMAFGVPVVATNVGGIPEVLGNSNSGYICSKDSPLEFANAINLILADSLHASELGKNGRLSFETNFTSTSMALNYKRLLL